MRGWLLGSMAILSFITAQSGAVKESTTRALNRPTWLRDYATARELARRTGKPIFVVFRCEH